MLAPLTSSHWNFDSAAHLLVRAGFGGAPADIENALALGPEPAVNSLVDAVPDNAPPPNWAQPDDEADLRAQLKIAATPQDKQLVQKILREKFGSEMKDLIRWWVTRMLNTT